MTNEYLERFEELKAMDSFKAHQWLGKRRELVEEFSWAIPNDEAIDYLVELSPIIEIGAGNGYWAYLIDKAGGEITAYDMEPWENLWYPVEEYGRMTEETLLLCWPPYGEDMAYESVVRHIKQGGSTVVHVGEIGGCTGNEKFHQLLNERYVLVKTIDIPQYNGLNDALFHYERKI